MRFQKYEIIHNEININKNSIKKEKYQSVQQAYYPHFQFFIKPNKIESRKFLKKCYFFFITY